MQWRRAKAYSQDLRDRVFTLYDVGDAVGEIADALCVSTSYVSKALSRRRDTGETSARPQRCAMPPMLFELYDAIRAEVTSRPDATLAELRRWLGEVHGVSASDGLIYGTLAKTIPHRVPDLPVMVRSVRNTGIRQTTPARPLNSNPAAAHAKVENEICCRRLAAP